MDVNCLRGPCTVCFTSRRSVAKRGTYAEMVTPSAFPRPVSVVSPEVLCGSHTCSPGLALTPGEEGVACTGNICTDVECCEEEGRLCFWVSVFCACVGGIPAESGGRRSVTGMVCMPEVNLLPYENALRPDRPYGLWRHTAIAKNNPLYSPVPLFSDGTWQHCEGLLLVPPPP